MQQAYLDICGVPTKVMTWGRWIEESYTKEEPEDIILCIPGNPGVTEFYALFLQTLHDRLGYTVWVLCHAGHELPNNTYKKVPALKDNERLYGLKGQTSHKEAFIESYVPKNARIHFIGHSVGAYIILQLLKIPSIRSRTVGNYMLFPTIERMAESPNGILLTKLISHITWFVIFLTWIYTLLPSVLQYLLIKIYMVYFSVNNMHFKTIINFIDPERLRKVFCMAYDEMDFITKRDTDILTENKNKIKLYYGASDRWAPQRYCKDLQKDIPGIDAEICSTNYEHAFVLRHSVEVANLVADWIEK